MFVNQKRCRFRWQERWEDLRGVGGEENYNQNILYDCFKKSKKKKKPILNITTKIKVLAPSDVKTCSINLKESTNELS